MILMWRLLIVANGLCTLGAASHAPLSEKQRECVHESSIVSLELSGCDDDNSPEASVSHYTISNVEDGQHHQKNMLSHSKEQERTYATTAYYNSDSSVLDGADSTWHTEISHSQKKVTATTRPVTLTAMSDVITGLSEQSNSTLGTHVEAVSFVNISEAVTSEEPQVSIPAENAKKTVKPAVVIVILICVIILTAGSIQCFRRYNRRGVAVITRMTE
ncbi:uncharacterized protein LOC126299074 [Schistocerca gregaria]|uniref:uncharacterized protein LOC126299074 n=1 Tax=Schistocerca gregaria TaxID=7010 RepID=UPI00211E2B19|nr:uncharacterized protein LOC126299074 [Schistocerca gregaria]